MIVWAWSIGQAATWTVERGSDLQSVIDYASDGDTLFVGGKEFRATRHFFTDPLCGNCQDAQTEIPASYGFRIKDKSLVIIGADREATRLVTNAGYGIYFENSSNSILMNLTVTGGRRDANGDATNAGIVARNSVICIRSCDIVDNMHQIDSVIVGIGGIIGREGAELIIKDCRIENNGWDGIALYRGASALVTDCKIAAGRGAGIGVTWDATCQAYRNDISGCWKGIGAFGSSWVVARNNLVHDNLGWGIIATGQAFMDITNNVVHHNGNCGIAPWSTESRGRIINNIVTKNGWRDRWVCPCVGIWNHGDWAKWRSAHNIVWGNEGGDYEDIWDQTSLHGNLCEDPLFISETDYHLQAESPAINAGDSMIFNTDGSISHIGLYGGPQAR